MAEIQFANNVRDLSNATGVDAGFQFEFYCERCSDRWRTHFKPYRSAQASGWLQKGASMFGGMLGNAGRVLSGVAEAGWHSARDEAFTEAITAGKAHFNRCGNCHDYVDEDMQLVCPQCRAESHGGKFCPECGFKMVQQVACTSCATMLQPGTKFCTECGTRQA